MQLCLGLVPLLAAGCGDSPPAAAAKDSPPVAQPLEVQVDPAMLAEVRKAVELAYQGTERPMPTSAPKPQAGKKVWIISPGQIGESASIATNAAKEAGELIGRKMTLYDSKLDVSNFSLIVVSMNGLSVSGPTGCLERSRAIEVSPTTWHHI